MTAYVLEATNGEYFAGFVKKTEIPIMTSKKKDARFFGNPETAIKVKKHLVETCDISMNEGMLVVYPWEEREIHDGR